MCHQTVGLVARHLEAAGISTLSLTSARDITTAVNPPRAAFLDYPLGHTSGRAHEPELNREIVRAALAGFDTITQPGSIIDLSFRWAADDDWKDRVLRPDTGGDADGAETTDDRLERHATPQYQTRADAEAAACTHSEHTCAVWAGVDF